MQVAFTTEELLSLLKPREVRGLTTKTISAIAGLAEAKPGDLSFRGNPKYKAEVTSSKASVLLLPLNYEGLPGTDQVYYLVDNPSVALAKLCSKIEQNLWPKPAPGIHPTAWISPEATVSKLATIGAQCVVEAGVVIGDYTHLHGQVFVGRGSCIGAHCWLMPGVVISADCVLKDRVRLQPGAIIGSDGFGYEFVGGKHEKVPQVGNVTLENEVEIGANSTVDRARFSGTVIGEGTKIDNLVQIGHNVTIGKHGIICSHCGISGSTTLEDYVVLAGQVGVGGHLTVGKAAKVGAQAGVNESVPAGTMVRGMPAQPYMTEQRLEILRRKLPELFKRVQKLEEQT